MNILLKYSKPSTLRQSAWINAFRASKLSYVVCPLHVGFSLDLGSTISDKLSAERLFSAIVHSHKLCVIINYSLLNCIDHCIKKHQWWATFGWYCSLNHDRVSPCRLGRQTWTQIFLRSLRQQNSIVLFVHNLLNCEQFLLRENDIFEFRNPWPSASTPPLLSSAYQWDHALVSQITKMSITKNDECHL